jgi:hypothetical protein
MGLVPLVCHSSSVAVTSLPVIRSIPFGVLLGVVIFLAGCAPGVTASSVAPGDTEPEIAADDLRLRIGLLASDAMRGRDTGSPGLRSAADYLASEMSRLGWEPAGDDGAFLQRVPLERRTTSAEFTATTPAGSIALTPEDILSVSGLGGLPSSSRERGNGPLVYAGSIADPEVGANELTLDALQSAVVILRLALPEGVDPASAQPRMAMGALFSPASPAAAILLVAEETEEEFWEYASEVTRTGSVSLPSPSVGGSSGPPFFLISVPAAERLIGGEIATARQPRAALGTIEFEIANEVEEVDGWNVAAILRGRDPARADEYVGLGAHYDHVGVGAAVDGDSIYNGADDNASGTAALVEVAEALAALPASERPARSVLIVWNTAEESGLLGSEFFTDRPTVPRDDIVAHLNLDMVGRNHPDSLSIVGSRRISTELGELVENVNRDQPSPFIFDYSYDSPDHPEQVYCRSDHYNYARYGIPVAFLSTGLHDDYHAPSDHADLIDYDKTARVSQLVLDITRALADRPARPTVDRPVPPLGTPCQG